MAQPPVVSKNGKVDHGKRWMPAMYVAYFGIIEKLAKEHGYALCVHGSVVRDFDLIAVPFDVQVSPHHVLLAEIKKVIGLGESSDKVFDLVGHEPHGRTCYTLESGGGGYFDISFTPTIEQAMAKAQQGIHRKYEIEDLLKKTEDLTSKRKNG